MKDLTKAFTIDPYYDVNFYNQTKMALTNNGIDYVEMISTKAPYPWYFVCDQLPIAINHDVISKSLIRHLITKVKPLAFNDEYRLYRKGLAKGNDVLQFIENEPLRIARTSKYACFFNVKNKAELISISESYPGKIFFMGRYFNNKYKVCLATHEAIHGAIDEDAVLLEKNSNGVGVFEAEFNYRILKNKDFLVKYTETPYMHDGKYSPVKIQGDRVSSAKYILN